MKQILTIDRYVVEFIDQGDGNMHTLIIVIWSADMDPLKDRSKETGTLS